MAPSMSTNISVDHRQVQGRWRILWTPLFEMARIFDPILRFSKKFIPMLCIRMCDAARGTVSTIVSTAFESCDADRPSDHIILAFRALFLVCTYKFDYCLFFFHKNIVTFLYDKLWEQLFTPNEHATDSVLILLFSQHNKYYKISLYSYIRILWFYYTLQTLYIDYRINLMFFTAYKTVLLHIQSLF